MGNARRQLVVLVPVLRRPHRVKPLMESVMAATPEPHRVLFIADENDKEELAALREAKAEFITVEPLMSWARKINEGFRQTTEPWILCGADDLDFYAEWFERAMAWETSEIGVIGTNDLCNPRTMSGQHSTHMLVRRSYIDEHGTIDGEGVVHEGYAHEYADDELVQTALTRDAYVHAFDSLVEHLHPWGGTAEDDYTYKLGRTHTQRSKALFRRRTKLWNRQRSSQPATNRTRPDHR